jgi:YidC/Oxa1 family membrane protein insertase
MKRMQKFTPEINRIKEKYKDDKQAQQREMMQFLGKHKINPAKGCLPILPQIPVFIAFYNVLSQSIELRHAPFYGWIQDLSAQDPYYVTPLLLGVGMLIQQKLTPNPTMDKTQERIMMMMPIMFTFMMLTLPAGMVLYMITNTIVSILQQQWLNRHLKVEIV